MFTWFRDLRFPVVVLVLGFILVIAGFFQVSDITKLSIIPHPGPLYGVIGIGIALIIVSIVLCLMDRHKGDLPRDLDEEPKLLPKSVFLSAPMNSFVVAGRPEDYKKSRAEILRIIATLKRECGIRDVFYAGETIEDMREFDLPGASLKDDFRKIQEREFFILLWISSIFFGSRFMSSGDPNPSCLKMFLEKF